MATPGQNYAVGIGTGAAGGAASGAAIGGPWGALIGGVVGAGGGAVGAAMANKKEADEKRRMIAAQQRSRQSIWVDLLRNYAAKHGQDTTYLDTLRQLNGEDLSNQAQDAQFAAQHRIDPMSFAPIAQYGTQAAGSIYKSLNTPSAPAAPRQIAPENLQPFGGNVQLQQPQLVSGGPAPVDNGIGNGFQLQQPDWLRGLT